MTRSFSFSFAIASLGALALALPLVAETSPDSEATKAFTEANMNMHHNMTMQFSGNADVDFIRGMIPHHQGAVDMAQIILKYGTDPEVKKFAEGIIAAQEAEISWMNDWLARNGG